MHTDDVIMLSDDATFDELRSTKHLNEHITQLLCVLFDELY